MRLHEAIAESEAADKEAERCRLAWLIGQTAHPSAIDPFLSEAYCIAANAAAEAFKRYEEARMEEMNEVYRGEFDRQETA